jgi:hypothetical protein
LGFSPEKFGVANCWGVGYNAAIFLMGTPAGIKRLWKKRNNAKQEISREGMKQ